MDPATDHDLLLQRILPHVNRGVIDEAKHAIADFDSDEDNHLLSEDLHSLHSLRNGNRRRSATPSLQTRTETPSEFSYHGTFSGGLSPPRRAAAPFATFDSAVGSDMAENSEAEAVTIAAVNGYTEEQQDLEWKAQLRTKQPSAASSLRRGEGNHRESATAQGPVIPARQASHQRKVNPSMTEFGNGTTRVVVRPAMVDHDGEDVGKKNGVVKNGNGVSIDELHSPVPRNGSSTPPPIPTGIARNNPMPRDFAPQSDDEEPDDDEDDDDGGYEYQNGHDPRRGLARTYSNDYQDAAPRSNRQPPPQVSRNKERQRLNSLNSDRSHRANAPVHAPTSRTAVIAQNHRDLRTPVLNHAQLYHDADPRRPYQYAEVRQPKAKTYRSVDDTGGGTYQGYGQDYRVGGGGGGGGLRRSYSDDEISLRQPSMSARTVASTSSQNNGAMPDFFSAGIFQIVLHNPTTSHQLLKFAETRFCAENVEFLTKVDEYRTTLNSLATQMAGIHKAYISPASATQINVEGTLIKRAHRDMKSLINLAFPSMENVFTELQEHIEMLVFQDIYPRFVRHQVALSATRALASNRFKYQGLGDCFCLTNPNMADNPILYASDGFVKVTGYTRPEIIPRNCRFLQGAHTDRQAVNRLKSCILDHKESVELLLNYKKNGDPFWNLLYVTPLYNAKGKVDLFLGGQVNCSTTIHSNVDVMKVLSLSANMETEDAQNANKEPAPVKPAPTKPSARRTILRAFGVRQDAEHVSTVVQGDAGMEETVLGRMQGQDLGAQMKEFYTAYSKFLIVRASTFVIEYFSEGIVESLNPANLAGTMVAGAEVFRFFGSSMLAKQSDYKVRVKNAIRAGAPVSTALRLQTKRSSVFRGDEAFVAHWTPLKDEKAAVHWVVVTLAPMM